MEILFMLIGLAGLVLFLFVRFILKEHPPLWKAKWMHNHGTGTRKLGAMESSLYRKGRKGQLLLSNVLIIRAKERLDDKVVLQALIKLAKCHPLLCMRVIKEHDSDEYYFQTIEEFQVDLTVDMSEDWKATMQQALLDKTLSKDGLLWRVIYMPKAQYDDRGNTDYEFQCAFVFVFNHAMIDGTSYTRLFGEFIDRLDEALTGKVRKVERMELLPPMDAYISDVRMRKPSVQDRLFRNVILVLKHMPWLQRFIIRRFHAQNPPHFMRTHKIQEDLYPCLEKRTCIIPTELSRQETTQLLRACKRRNITVHGALHTAAVIAYCNIVYEGTMKESADVNTASTVNMRQFLEGRVPANYVGPFFLVCLYKTMMTPDLDFWDISTRTSTDIHTILEEKKQLIDMFYVISDWEGQMDESLAAGGRLGDLVFTNLGNLSFLDRDNAHTVRITARFGCSSEHSSGSVFANNIATFNGKLFWTFVYYPNITTEEFARKFAKLTMDILRNAIKD